MLRAELQGLVVEITAYEMGQPLQDLHMSLVVVSDGRWSYGYGSERGGVTRSIGLEPGAVAARTKLL